MKKNIPCPCGKVFSAEYEEETDLDRNPEFIDKILDGTYINFTCPDCEKVHKPEYPVSLLWQSKKLNFEVLPEMDRGEFYRRKKANADFETIIGYQELADRIAVVRDGLEPVAIEALKYYLLIKAEETYPDLEISAWYQGNVSGGIEFHLYGITSDEVAVMRIPREVYEKTLEDYRKHPGKDIFASLRIRSYLSVQNITRPDFLK
ncbi:MAG: CpXC domain-containing protein [Treponema sp.]|nr:CpXC domain-containing protein [Treponema sp.]